MRSFLQRLSSRKFLTALAVQIASVAALFWPQHEQTIHTAAVRVAALFTLLLAALGYGRIEAAVDKEMFESSKGNANPKA
ncbi:MAG: hypothetical protein ACYTF6_00110 [Planctomycetota bacterium]|jgi:hypothetical protein